MNKFDQLMIIASHWASTRQVGNTTVPLMGVSQAPAAVYLCHSNEYAETLRPVVNEMKLPVANPVLRGPIQSVHDLKGYNMPLVVDHFYMSELILALPSHINSEARRARIEEIEDISQSRDVEMKSNGVVWCRHCERALEHPDAPCSCDILYKKRKERIRKLKAGEIYGRHVGSDAADRAVDENGNLF